MDKKLTEEQVTKLFAFCREHFVYHYDLQMELVDHLASSIENQWAHQPELRFEIALNNAFGNFGISGFSKIKVEKQKELARKYNRLLWKYFLEFYRWPKMLMTLAGTMVLFTLLRMVNNIAWVIVPYFALLVISSLFYFYFVAPKKLKIQIVPGKKFMLLEYVNQIQMAVVLLSQTPIAAYNISRVFHVYSINQPWVLLLISFLIISLNIILYGQFFFVPEKIKEHFKEQFPEFAL
ncbi:MAG TPA: hypothetical protein VLQ91_15120 [Draconibacterium sp.]|nr:hypothetical protein [Draconibacterium sp.]